ncbi:MAG: 2,3-dihydroxybiphenyl 1,2-dioxygenase [Chloroflexi bacterium]|nr:2,3-dihydroxybiphenyl 1,2-dioxygenase [Chloroflexota bacterium]
MAELVEIIGITHNPYLPGMIAGPDPEPGICQAEADYARMRQKMADARPDVLVVIASDHLNQWFMDNMPPFLIGKAPRTHGPAPQEVRTFRLTPYEADVDIEVAKGLLRESSRFGVDFAFSDEFFIDHAFTVPLGFVRPEMDIPIVPIFTNVMAPPIPPADRFYQVGQAIRRMIEVLPSGRRIGILSSGHLAVEVGGPKSSSYSADVEFDERMMKLIAAGDAETVVKEATWERMLQAGNVTPGFSNYVLLMGLAHGRAPDAVGLHFPKKTAAVPYMAWDLTQGDAR